MRFGKDGRVAYAEEIEGGYWRVLKGTEHGIVIEHYQSAEDAERMLKRAGWERS